MKKLVILSIFISTSTIGFGQFFQSDDSEEEYQTNLTQHQFFSNESDQGTNSIPDPHPGDDEVPVNHWQLYLSVLGVILGGYFLSRHRN